MQAATFPVRTCYGADAPALAPALSGETVEIARGRFRCLIGRSGRRYMFCAVSPVRAALYRDCILAIAPAKSDDLAVVEVVPQNVEEVFVHCLDGDDLAAVEQDLHIAR